jgi:hypothetical protein
MDKLGFIRKPYGSADEIIWLIEAWVALSASPQ